MSHGYKVKVVKTDGSEVEFHRGFFEVPSTDKDKYLKNIGKNGISYDSGKDALTYIPPHMISSIELIDVNIKGE